MKAGLEVPHTLAPSAARAAWAVMLEAMQHPVWLVDAAALRIVASNSAAADLVGTGIDALVGRPVLDFSASPEDEAFWHEVADGARGGLDSEALVRRVDGALLLVTRRISRVPSNAGSDLFIVALEDRSLQVRRERELELAVAELQATLESLGDGVLVVDLRGRIRNFNRRFADLWEIPEALLTQRVDDAVLDWMRAGVADPARYMRRLAVIDDATMLRASDVVTLRSGRVIERVTMPQFSRGNPIGRVYTFREIRPAARPLPLQS